MSYLPLGFTAATAMILTKRVRSPAAAAESAVVVDVASPLPLLLVESVDDVVDRRVSDLSLNADVL